MAYFDLEFKARTDGQFQYELMKHGQRLQEARIKDNGSNHLFQIAMWDFMQFCKFNLVFLTGYYWPRYPKDSPLVFGDYPFAFSILNFQVGGFTVFRGSRQIGKSSAFCIRQLLLARLFPGFASGYICPRSQQLQTYANRLLGMQRASIFAGEVKSKYRDNLRYKELANGSRIELAYVNTTADNIRGRTLDEILFDEFQSFDMDLLLECSQCQVASECRSTIFAGTSLTTDTPLEDRFSQSSQALAMSLTN